MEIKNFESIQIKIASPEKILSWSHGEVLEPETINYRTLKPEKDGLFCERIFGPTKEFQCYCGKYRGRQYRGIICDRCGVEVTHSSVRRERMGHIELVTPVAHIWFLRGIPSAMGMVLNISRRDLSNIVYFVSYVITSVSKEGKERIREEIEAEYKDKVKSKKKELKGDEEELKKAIRALKQIREKTINEFKKIEKYNVLSELEYRKLSLKYGEVFEAKTGAEALYDMFSEVNLKEEIKELKERLKQAPHSRREDILRRLKFFEGMEKAGIRPEWMFLKILPVLPPGLRPMVQLDGGRYASSDLNDLYRRVINRNNRLKYLLEISAPEVIIKNEKRMLQEAVDALIDNQKRTSAVTRSAAEGRRPLKSLADMLKGKKGRFRRNLLGKRVDYSGRAVIVVGPDLPLDQAGIPKEMALEVFKPFVMRGLLEREDAYNVRTAKELIESGTDEVWAVLEDVVKDKYILLNRAPTLHRLSIQAFKPKLIEGNVISIPPLTCPSFNADFDGDQMAMHLPLSEEAQKEAKEIMLSTLNVLRPANGKPIINPSQDMVLGVYWLTTLRDNAKGEGRIFSSAREAILAYEFGQVHVQAKIKFRVAAEENSSENLIETSVGRIIFNENLPSGFPFYNNLLRAKDLNEITWQIVKKYEPDKAAVFISRLKHLGFYWAEKSGLSLGVDDFVVPEEKKAILEKAGEEVEKATKLFQKGLLSDSERKEKVIGAWSKAKNEIEKIVPQKLSKHSSAFIIPDSGSRGSWTQPIQIGGMRGLMVSPSGEIIELPVKGSFKEGLHVLEYFISTHGARKGITDKALGTAKAGYLTRRLADVAHQVIVREEDCGDNKGRVISRSKAQEIGQKWEQKIVGRVSLETVRNKNKDIIVKKGEIISWDMVKEMERENIEKIRVRSPFTCRTRWGLCQKCYGWDMGKNKLVGLGQAVGVVAAQSIGEPGTQLTMRVFHTGGIAGEADITQGLPRVESLFETRKPKVKAILSKTFGQAISVKDNVVEIRTKPENKGQNSETLKYKIPVGLPVLVKKGDSVEKGQRLCEGDIDLQEVFRLLGEDYVKEYLLQEIQNAYISQGVTIHDKHFEVIIREMFSRKKVIDPGDTSFVPGEVISESHLLDENDKVKKNNGQEAKVKSLLLGISKIALTSDSVLSAASFQRTSKVLIEASLKGKEDLLRGLKENVLVGKLVPVGTGFKNPAKK